MRNRNAVKRAAQSFVVAIVVTILAGCGQNPGGSYTPADPIQPAMAESAAPNSQDFHPDAALQDVRLTVNSDWVIIDANSTAVGSIKLESTANTSQAAHGGAVFPGPIKDIYISAPAQPGRFLRVVYGYGPIPIGPTTSTTFDSIAIGHQFYENNVSNAGAVVVLVTAAQNVNGIIVRSSSLILAAGAAPAAINQGRLEYGNSTNAYFTPIMAVALAAVGIQYVVLPQTFAVPPGRILQFRYFSDNAANFITTNIQYDIL